MKTPISYYGGKQNMLKEILPLIPKHDVYVEPFVGGGAVLFAKEQSKVEVINDINGNLATFYRVLKNDSEGLNKLIQDTLHCEYTYKQTKEIYKNSDSGDYSDVQVAWACWVQCNCSFANSPTNGWGNTFNLRDKLNSAIVVLNKKELFGRISKRLSLIHVNNSEAVYLIKKLEQRSESKKYFYYLDPPYPESDCKHYEKEKHVYYELLDLLPIIKGKWLMSSYPSEELNELRRNCKSTHTKTKGLNFKDIEKNLSVSGKHNAGKKKTECLTWNYDLIENQISLF